MGQNFRNFPGRRSGGTCCLWPGSSGRKLQPVLHAIPFVVLHVQEELRDPRLEKQVARTLHGTGLGTRKASTWSHLRHSRGASESLE